MSLLVIAGTAWIVLSVGLAVLLGRTIRLADAREHTVSVFGPFPRPPRDPSTP